VFWHRTKVQGSDDTLATLKKSIEDTEARFRRLEGEWLDTLERINRALGRLAKRAQRAEEPEPGSPEALPLHTASVDHDPVLLRRSGRTRPGGS